MAREQSADAVSYGVEKELRHSERARDRDEVLVLYAHDITPDDAKKDPHNITLGQLEAILARAAELNLPVIGFDELDGLGR